MWKLLEKDISEAVFQRRSYKKVLWKYAAYLQENIYAEVRFETLLKWHFSMGVLL